MNLLEDYKTEVASVMKDIFDTFKRETPLRFYKPSIEHVVIFDENFNSDLQEYSDPNVTLTEQYTEFYCRIIYLKAADTFSTFIGGGENITAKAEQDFGLLNIQMESDAYEYVKDTIRFTFMGDNYRKIPPIRKLGVLGTFNLYQLNLKKVE
jgi:hypothetical protein